MARVFVGMSGGVDSSVAAALLVEQGHDVTGVTMLLAAGESASGALEAPGVAAARATCAVLGIPHLVWDLREDLARDVVDDFVDEYARGRTPNPCVRCNERIKFGALLRRVTEAGGDLLATGHYARVADAEDGPVLARAADADKDQSYFLYRLGRDVLERVVFPLGGMTKRAVRASAERSGLPGREARESQEACFLAGGDVRAFVRQRRPEAFTPGEIVDAEGAVVGSHDGVPGLTVGQRSRIGGAPEPRFITGIDAAGARVRVGERAGLLVDRVHASDPVWRRGEEPARCTARVRYRGVETSGTARMGRGVMEMVFDEPISAPAPGQALVCWDGDIVIGGGVIEGVA